MSHEACKTFCVGWAHHSQKIKTFEYLWAGFDWANFSQVLPGSPMKTMWDDNGQHRQNTNKRLVVGLSLMFSKGSFFGQQCTRSNTQFACCSVAWINRILCFSSCWRFLRCHVFLPSFTSRQPFLFKSDVTWQWHSSLLLQDRCLC